MRARTPESNPEAAAAVAHSALAVVFLNVFREIIAGEHHSAFLFLARHFRIYSFIYSRWYRFRSNGSEVVVRTASDTAAVDAALAFD